MSLNVPLGAHAVVTEEEALRYIFKDREMHTEEEKDVIAQIINGVSAAIEGYIGNYVVAREITEFLDGGREIVFLSFRPVRELKEITEDGNLLTPDQYYLYEREGYIKKAFGRFVDKPRCVKVVYRAGIAEDVTTVPDDIKLAALIWCDVIWNNGPANLSNPLEPRYEWVENYRDMPRQVAKLLERYRKGFHIA